MTAPDLARPWPKRLRFSRAERRLAIDLDTGETVEVPYELLRVESPSAEVQGHGPSGRTLVTGKRLVQIERAEPVGNYAVRLVFDDGHDTGLFTWDYLVRLARERDALMAAYEERLAKAGRARSSAS
jgi:DUF971 family protein